jgi:hypothetical protein
MRKQKEKWASGKSVMLKIVEKSLNKELMREKVVKLWKRKSRNNGWTKRCKGHA